MTQAADRPGTTEARHVRWADVLFRRYLRGLMAADFHDVRLAGPMPVLRDDLPVLIVANHSTWWDGFFIYLLNRDLLHRKLHLMMLEEQLRRFPFFSRVGAFGIRQGQPRSVLATLRYCARVLSAPGTTLCIFPQGVLTPAGSRPLAFQRGIEKVMALHGAGLTILPVAIRCEFLGERKPSAFLLPGEPLVAGPGSYPGAAALEHSVTALLDRLDALVIAREPGTLLVGRR